jgi:hypothetical protein
MVYLNIFFVVEKSVNNFNVPFPSNLVLRIRVNSSYLLKSFTFFKDFITNFLILSLKLHLLVESIYRQLNLLSQLPLITEVFLIPKKTVNIQLASINHNKCAIDFR